MPERTPSSGCDMFHGWATLLASRLDSRRYQACTGQLVRKVWMSQRTIWDLLSEIFGVAVGSWMRAQDLFDSPSPHSNLSEPLSQTMSDSTRHPQFWFNDGDIILIAQLTGFHIYRGLLAAQSIVFADMFASSSFHDDEAFHGCPITHLSDSHHDLAHLLRVLLPTSPSIRCGLHFAPRRLPLALLMFSLDIMLLVLNLSARSTRFPPLSDSRTTTACNPSEIKRFSPCENTTFLPTSVPSAYPQRPRHESRSCVLSASAL